jgi:hypothetical protein
MSWEHVPIHTPLPYRSRGNAVPGALIVPGGHARGLTPGPAGGDAFVVGI